MRRHRLTSTAVTVLAACAVAAPSAGAVDLRSPDTRDAARTAGAVLSTSDLRSADARAVVVPARVHVDLRSPDARDSELQAPTGSSAPAVTVQRVTSPSDFDWGDAGIGAGIALAVVLIGFAAVVAVSHHGRTGGSGPSPLAS